MNGRFVSWSSIHRTQRNLNRFHKREEDENPWTEEKLYLPSHTDSIDVFKSCDKTDVREDEYPEEQDWETGSDDIENTSSAKEVDSDIQSISDCINDPYGDSNSFLLQASNDSDLETDAILNNGPREKCDTEYLRSNSDMEPGKYIPDRGRRARSKQDIRNKRYASIRKKKKSCPSSAKKSEETIIRAENIMIGKHNKLILSEDIKLDNIKQTLDNIKQTLDGFEESMKIKIEKLSAIVLEVSRKPNRIHSECTGIGIVPAPCNCGQYVANVASKIRHCQKCNLKQSSAQGLQYSHGDSSSLFMHSLFNNAIPIDASAKEENTDYMRTKSDMRLGNYVQDRETNRLKSKKLQMGKTKMIKVSSPKRSEETAMRGENGIVGTPKALISTAFEKWDDTSGTKTDSNSDFPPDEFLQLLE